LVLESILQLYEALHQPRLPKIKHGVNQRPIDKFGYPYAFFYGTAQLDICTCGFHIIQVEGQAFDIHWNGGPGTNNKEEIMALAGLIIFSDFLGLKNLHSFGDSEVTIDHALSKNRIKNIHLAGWLDRLEGLWLNTKDYTISHIDRGKNQRASALSK